MRNRHVVFFLMIAGMLLAGCNNNDGKKIPSDVVNNPNTATGKQSGKKTAITFDKMSHDFGQVIEGEVVSYHFKFENTGKSDLIIANVSSSCGCTVTDYPEEPIKPGKEGTLEVTFDSNRRSGFQNKKITVLTNAQPSETVLSIKAKVIRP